jgi:hypothetical protein
MGPWIVKARGKDGGVAAIICSGRERALDCLRKLRESGFAAWIEDAEGQRIDERLMGNGRAQT